jgi:hypothetical protein
LRSSFVSGLRLTLLAYSCENKGSGHGR